MMKKKNLLMLGLAAMLLAVSQWCGAQELRMLAKVGDKVITSFDLERMVAERLNSLPGNLEAKERQRLEEDIRRNALDELINAELIYMDFKELKAKVPVSAIQERLDNIIMAQTNGDEERFRDMLHRSNITYAEFRENIARRIAVEMLVYDRTRRNIYIGDDVVLQHYNALSRQNSRLERWRVSVIMLKGNGRHAGRVNAVAGEIHSRLAKGEDFGALAREYSEGLNEKNGGDMDWQSSFAPEMMAVVRSLQPGKVYPGVLSLGGNSFLLKLTDYDSGKATAEERRRQLAEIRNRLVDEEARRRYDEYIRNLNLKYPVRRFQ